MRIFDKHILYVLSFGFNTEFIASMTDSGIFNPKRWFNGVTFRGDKESLAFSTSNSASSNDGVMDYSR